MKGNIHGKQLQNLSIDDDKLIIRGSIAGRGLTATIAEDFRLINGITASVLTVNTDNGIELWNDNVVLGGTLSKWTDIDISGNTFSFLNSNVNLLNIFPSGLSIGSISINDSAVLDINSSSKGVLIPRLTLSERDTITSPESSLLIFNIDLNQFEFWDSIGMTWSSLASGSTSSFIDTRNGISLNDGYVELGGTLSNNTTIDLGTSSLFINNVFDFYNGGTMAAWGIINYTDDFSNLFGDNTLITKKYVDCNRPNYAISNLDMVANNTVGDNATASNIPIIDIPVSFVKVFINGMEIDTPQNEADYTIRPAFFADPTIYPPTLSSVRKRGTEQLGDILYWNGTVAGYNLSSTDKIDFNYLTADCNPIVGTGSSVNFFTELVDTPGDYIGNENKFVAVNTTADGLIFVDAPTSSNVGNFLDLTDTPSDYTGFAGKVLAVNPGATGVNFVDINQAIIAGDIVSSFSDIRNYVNGVTQSIDHNLGTTDIVVEFWLEDGLSTDAIVKITGTNSIDVVTNQNLNNLKTVVISSIIISSSYSVVGTPDYAAKFIGTQSIGDSSWAYDGNNYYPVNNGSSLGLDSNRIDTIYMSSVINYSSSGNGLEIVEEGISRMFIDIGGNIGVNTVSPQGIFDISSTQSGVLIPRMTQNQRDLITPSEGMLLYQTDNDKGFYFWNGTIWNNVSATESGVSAFTELTDTPDSFTSSGSLLVVNDTSDGLVYKRPEFETVIAFETTNTARDLYSKNVSIISVTHSSDISSWEVNINNSGYSTPGLPFSIGSLETVLWQVTFSGPTGGVLLIRGEE
jgi:hypothetical protein